MAPSGRLMHGPDCALWVEVHGAGEPVSVWAHGVTSSTAELAPMAARTPGTRVLFDFRGHGSSESPPPEAGYGYPAMRRDLAFVADTFGATRAFGVSLGAGVLCHLLADEPNRFDRLGFFIPSAVDALAPGSQDLVRMAETLERVPLERVAEEALASPAYAPLLAVRPWWRDLVRERILRMNPTGVPRAIRAFAAGPPPVTDAGALGRVEAPVLVLAHEGDPMHDAAAARRLSELLPNATVRIWGEPLAMLDDPDAFAALVGGFLGA